MRLSHAQVGQGADVQGGRCPWPWPWGAYRVRDVTVQDPFSGQNSHDQHSMRLSTQFSIVIYLQHFPVA